MKKILVSLPDGVVNIIDKELIGKVGQTRSDTLRTIIMNWLNTQGYLAKGEKHEEQPSNTEDQVTRTEDALKKLKNHTKNW
jgi:metal-responsive CopG/Arc/MetJ family transcriptional regulator